ncbi:DUF6284 family protein [Longispora albida]|uniref:DUF6284 family protein n=1 Tax=Longispora albida TaxID=203523 RepID=UPI00035E4F02|nr:DUF6284 family protein [Longispora albida]
MMSIPLRYPGADPDGAVEVDVLDLLAGPGVAELAEIEAEWPELELGLELTGLELARIDRPATELDFRRERRLVRQILAMRKARLAAAAGHLVLRAVAA